MNIGQKNSVIRQHPLKQGPAIQWRQAILLGVVLIFGSTLTLLAGLSHQEHEASLVKEKQVAATQAVVSAFDLELTRTSEAIRNAGLMIESNPNLTRDQFNRYMQKLVTSQLSVSLVEWQPMVPAGELAQFEAAARKEGASNYRVVQPDASGKGWEPVSGRDTYVPVRLAWPADYQTEGLDMSFSPERMASKLASQRTRMPVASGIFPFMKSGMVDSGVKAVAISTTVFDNNNSARGYVAAIVDLPTLFQRAAQVADSVQLDLLVYSGGANSTQPFYTRFGDGSDLKQGKVDLGLATAGDPSATVSFGEQTWRVVLHPRAGFYAALPPAHSPLMYASGFGLTLLMLVMLALNLRTNMRLQERTADLARSHQSLSEAQRIAQIGNWELDLLTKALIGSDEILRIFETDKIRFGASFDDFRAVIHPQDLDAVNVAYRQSLENRQPYRMTYRLQMPDGRIKYVDEQGESFFDANGKPLRSVGTVQDITERKQAEAALQDTQAMLARTEEIGKIGGWEFDIDTMQQTWTKTIYAIHEVDFTGHPTVEQGISFYTPESRPIIEQAVQRAIQHGEPFDLELEIITAKGNLRAVHTIGRHDPVRGKIVGFFQDITERKRAEVALTETNNRLTAVMANLNEGLIMADHLGLVSYWNPMALAINGFASMDDCRRPLAEFAQMFEFRLLNEDRPLPIEEWPMRRVLRGERLNDWEVRLRRLDQSWEKIVSYSGWLINSTHSETLGLLTIIDITERKRAEKSLQQAATVFSHTREGITITDGNGTILDVNEAFTRITGYSREDAIGQNPRILKSGRQSTEFYEEMWEALIEQGHWSGEIWNRRKDGEVCAELLSISAIRDEQGFTQQYVAMFSDITAIKAHQSQLEHIAHFDALTNLPNRVLLVDRLHQAMAQAQRRQQHLVVVYLDLDGFKAINDQYGHETGDQALIVLAKNLKEALREGDTLARIGGDEFVAVLADLEDTSASLPLLKRLQAAAELPVELSELSELSLSLSASLGVTFYPQAQDIDGDQLLRQADQAMYQAKVAGKNRYCIFDAAVDSNVRKQHERLARIRLALERHEFVLYYQPKVNMRTGKVIGAEALIRWQHPEDGLLAPATFLPVIEDHPLAVDVGEWVIDTAMRQMEVWHAAGLDLPVSVNIGARQLLQDNFVERLRVILARHPQVPPGCIELEVLETSALADMAQASQVIEDCAEFGLRFALDDFGTGYSSLTYLKRLRVALLKIDQSFVRDMLDDPDDLAILQGIIGLAAAFNREVIAEGVETVAHGTALLHLGCELAQGYGIARPMPPDQLPAWAATWQPDAAWGGVMHSGEASRSTDQ